MNVAIMARSLRPGATGVGRHVGNLIQGLAGEMPAGDLTVFVTQDAPRSLPAGVREVRAPFPTPNEYARAFWEQTVVAAQTARLGIDVYHSPNYILPLALSRPSVVTIHDLTFLDRRLHRLTSHYYLAFFTGFAVRRADAIIAVSEYTRLALLAHYPETAGRIEVIHQAVDPTLVPPDEGQVGAFRQQRGFGQPYILFVGTQEPRKNLVRLIHAFEQAVQEQRLPHHLVFIGPRGWKTGDLDAAVEQSPLRERIHQMGYVPAGELPCWYACADLFVYPSVEEGFGLPPLEAMTMGTPVITSNVSSLPEVVGQAAITVDPGDTDALAAAIARVVTEAGLAEWLRSEGRMRARSFTWSEAARRHIALYQRVQSGAHS